MSTWSYNAADEVSNAGWQYDAAGNLFRTGSVTYTYDVLNRPVNVQTVAQTSVYTYNGDGLVMAVDSYGSVKTYQHDLFPSLSQIQLERRPGASTRFYYGLNQFLAYDPSILASYQWYVTDGLGSVRVTLSNNGTVIATPRYDPWGKVISSGINYFGFTGEWQDPGLDLVYLRARWYNTTLGRFLTRDPFEGISNNRLVYIRISIVMMIQCSILIQRDNVLHVSSPICLQMSRARQRCVVSGRVQRARLPILHRLSILL